MAAYELYCSGYSKLSVLKGGMSEWQRAERCAQPTPLRPHELLWVPRVIKHVRSFSRSYVLWRRPVATADDES